MTEYKMNIPVVAPVGRFFVFTLEDILKDKHYDFSTDGPSAYLRCYTPDKVLREYKELPGYTDESFEQMKKWWSLPLEKRYHPTIVHTCRSLVPINIVANINELAHELTITKNGREM